MFKTFRNALKVKDLRSKLLYTLMALVIVRLGSLLPVPGINRDILDQIMQQQTGLGFLNTFTGGSFGRMALFALGIGPYITSSIIMQLLTIVIPKLEEMQKDGEEGRKKIAEISRYVTVALALIEGSALIFGFRGYLDGGLNFLNFVTVLATLVAGSAFLMWLGERITEKGVGNGISIILLINIVADLPSSFTILFKNYVFGASTVMNGILGAVVIVAILAVMLVLILLLQDGERRIPVQYAKKMQGRKMVGGQTTSIPIKVNTAGVIPVIFASSFMQFPIIIASFFQVEGARTTFWHKVLYLLNQKNWCNIKGEGEFKYTLGLLIYIALIIFFAYFYTSVTFNPIEVANNMKKQGGFIPGIRPGKPTTDYLTKVLNNIILIGAVGLTIVAVIPIFFSGVFSVTEVSFGGTSLIIVVGVILETIKQIESQLLVRHYKGFLND